MSDLKSCPCGAKPIELLIADAGQGGKWAYAYGDCCSNWEIEFRTDYNDLQSEKCMSLAVESWNDAPRGEGELTNLKALTKDLTDVLAKLDIEFIGLKEELKLCRKKCDTEQINTAYAETIERQSVEISRLKQTENKLRQKVEKLNKDNR